MFLANQCESTVQVGEMRVKADESGSQHTEAGPLVGDRQLMGSQWGADDERRIMGCRRTDSGRKGWQDEQEVSGC